MARVLHIFISPVARGPMLALPDVNAVAGKGLEGDRYFKQEGTFSATVGRSGEVTLIESEAIEALVKDAGIHLLPAEPRRNLVTCGVALNDLVGKTFCVGEVTLRGLRLCNPCDHLELLTQSGVKQALANRGGLRAEIARGGRIRVNDEIIVVGAAAVGDTSPQHNCHPVTEYDPNATRAAEFQRLLSYL